MIKKEKSLFIPIKLHSITTSCVIQYTLELQAVPSKKKKNPHEGKRKGKRGGKEKKKKKGMEGVCAKKGRIRYGRKEGRKGRG